MRRLFPVLIVSLFVGCSPRLDVKKELTELGIEGVTFDLSAVKVEQKITVKATATGGPVDVYVFLKKNKAAVEKEVLAKKLASAIESAEGQESVSLQATISANEEASVWVRAANFKKPTVSVEINNKK